MATSSPQWRPVALPAGVGLSTTSLCKLFCRHGLEAARTGSAQARCSHESVALGASLVAECSDVAVVADVDGHLAASPSGWEGQKGDLGAVAAAPRSDPACRAAPGLSPGGGEGPTALAASRYAIVT